MKVYKEIHDEGTKNERTLWFNEDKHLHREDGPAVIYKNGYKEWRINGLYHREDGPAVTRYDGAKYWYKNGKCHREDGPAIIFKDGNKEWWLNNERYAEETFKKKLFKHNLNKLNEGS